MSRLKIIRIILWGFVALCLAGLAGLYVTDRSGGTLSQADQAPLRPDFALTGGDGQTVTAADFHGKWMLVFFGFTHCPDICPLGLANIAQVMDQLGPDAAHVAPVFISIDPDRDTPADAADFAAQFDAGITGLSGTPEQIADAASNFGVYYEKIEDDSAPDGYTMGHSAAIFLVDPDGNLARTFDYNAPAATMADDLKQRI